MKHAFTVILYIAIVLLTVQNHLVLAALCSLVYTYRVGALLLIPLAVCIDGFFGAFYHIPVFSIVATVWYLVSELIRPTLILQSKSYGEVT
jgi:hypothetical protein